MRVLLIQVRNEGDVMAHHEADCVRRRLGDRQVEVRTRNALTTPADPAWLEDIDCVIFGGSGDYSVHHESSVGWVTPLRHVLERILHDNLPGFAICFGHQLLGMHLGSPVLTCPNRTEIGTVRMRLTEAGQVCNVFSSLGCDFDVQTGHSDHVVETPTGVELLASNDVLDSQAFRVGGSRFYSTQFHPDLTAAEARHRYMAYRDAMGKVHPRAAAAAEQYDPERDGGPVEGLLGAFLDAVRF